MAEEWRKSGRCRKVAKLWQWQKIGGRRRKRVTKALDMMEASQPSNNQERKEILI